MARILVIDESLLDRKRIATVLEAVGHQVVEAESAAEARRKLAGQPRGTFQLITMEIRLPDAAGLEFLRSLKQDPATSIVPVLVVTPQPAREVIVETILAGAENMVAKPFAGEILLRRVTEILAGQRLLRLVDAGAVSWPVEEYLRREVKRARRSGLPLSVIVAAPESGPAEASVRDDLLKALSRDLRLRETDLVFGIAANQVVVVLPDTDTMGAHVVEARIRQLIQRLAQPGPDRAPLPVQVQTGVATMPEDGVDSEILVDTALGRAREGHSQAM